MHVTLVHVYVNADAVDDFIAASQANHQHSTQEPGNLRFDVLQDPGDSSHFILYEAYQDEAAAKAHKDTAHYLTWRDSVADMMAKPRQGVPMNGLLP